MSENITHTAILDDCFRLMLASDTICDAFKLAGREQRDFARLGGVTRYGDMFTTRLLDDYRARWATRTPEDKLEPKLAFVLGWLCHRAADRQMKPVFREAEPGRPVSPADCSVYHDAFVFKEIFADGRESPYHPAILERDMASLPAVQGLDVPGVEDFFRALLQRALIELHTLIPDRDDIDGWLDRLFSVRQRLHLDLERYAAAVAAPDPGKYQKFIVEMNFYDRDEPIIGAARGLQRGEAVTAEQVHQAVAAEARSHYAQALKMGYGYLAAASAFFAGDMSPETLAERLNIGKPGRDGESV